MIRQANEQKNMGPQCHKSPAWRILASALVFSIIGASGVTWGMTHLKRTLPFAQQFLNSNKLDWTIGTANKDQLFFKNSSAFGGPELYKKNHEASRPGWFGIPSDLGGGMGNEKDGSLPKHAPSLNSLQPGNSFDKNVLFKPIKPIAFSEEDFVKELLYGGKISAKRIRCAIEKSLKNAPDGFSYHLGTAISFVIDAINKQLEKAAKDNQEKVVENKELKDKLEEYKSLLEQINEAKQAPNQQREVAVGTEPLDMKKQLAVENNLAKARLEIEKLRRLLGTVQEEKNSVTQNLHTANQVITSLKNQLSAQEDAHRNELNRRESIFQQDKELLKRRLTEQELRFKEFEQKSMQRAKEEAAALRTSLEEQAQQLQEQTEKGRVAIGAKDAEIGALKGKITDLTGRLAAETGRAKQKDLDVKGLSGIVKKKDGEIKKKDDEIKKRDDDIKKKDDEIKKRDDGIKKKNMEIGILTERIKDIPKQIDDIVHTKTEDLIKKNDELNKKLENSEKMRNDSRKKYFDLRLRLEKLKKRTSKLNEKLERDSTELKKIRAEKSTYDSRFDGLLEQYRKLVAEFNALKDLLDAERKEAKNEKGALISTLSERDQRIFDLENALNKISTEAARLAKELEKACIARTKLAELAEQLEGAKREKDALLAKLEQERKVHDESERTSASRLEQIENKKC